MGKIDFEAYLIEIINLVKETPNNMSLGAKIRELIKTYHIVNGGEENE
jgi:hypothetical protein